MQRRCNAEKPVVKHWSTAQSLLKIRTSAGSIHAKLWSCHDIPDFNSHPENRV